MASSLLCAVTFLPHLDGLVTKNKCGQDLSALSKCDRSMHAGDQQCSSQQATELQIQDLREKKGEMVNVYIISCRTEIVII